MRIQDFFTQRVLAWAAMFAFGSYGLILLQGEIGTARNAAERFDCEEALRKIFARIESEQTKRDGRLTRDDIVGLLENMVSEHSGPCQDLRRAYVVAKNFKLPLPAGAVTRVIICDSPGNHIIHLANGFRARRNGVLQECASWLQSDGQILHFQGDSTDYSKWVAKFSKGEDPGELPEPDWSYPGIVWLP